jgi:NAD(P)-dependent dehydrogenase (short-subunit alcohol dehydrogenase family)
VAAGARESTADLIALAGEGDVAIVLGDLTTTAGCQALVDEAVARFGGVDVLVNNVGGVRPRTGGFPTVTDEDWQWAMEMNLLSAVRATRAALYGHAFNPARASTDPGPPAPRRWPGPGITACR